MRWVLTTVDGQKYALPLADVDRIARMVEVTPLPDVPDFGEGIIDVQGKVVPVVSTRKCLSLLPRSLATSDSVVLAHTRKKQLGIAGRLEPANLRGRRLVARRPIFGVLRTLGTLALVAGVQAHAAQTMAGDFANLSLEQLGDIQVTSVSRHAERLQDAPASIYVITAEDIRRSGVTSLPEALRLAPNLQVARVNASSYAISARGFNNSIGNKLLVLIDGRTVYTPLFSGVFWDAQDVMLEDVDRIEVISGPGATLWGANAVNGVINVITRRAGDTQGVLATAGGGNQESGAALRYGGTVGSEGHYRIYAKGFDRRHTETASGSTVRDGWDKAQLGFRADWGGPLQGFTLQGDAYDGREEQAIPGKTAVRGANLVARWKRQLEGGSNMSVQAYYDRTERDIPGTFSEKLDVFDIEFQHAISPAGRHRVLWGAGYRYGRDHVQNSPALAFLPADRDLHWANVFVQDDIVLTGTANLTLGGKFESNVYTGAEFLPSVRLAWKPAVERLVWGAISRAVRAPSRLDRELFIPGKPPFTLAGGPNFQSEVSNVIELGYRVQPTAALNYSVTVFHHIYDKLRSIEPAPGGGFVLGNKIEGSTSGIETWGAYQATPKWRLSAGAVILKEHLHRTPDSLDPTGPSALGNDPAHQWMLRSALNITDRHEFDVMVRHVGALPSPGVPAYTAVDARFGWKLTRDAELSLTAQNLFGPGHVEFGQLATGSELQRGVFLKLLWRMQ